MSQEQLKTMAQAHSTEIHAVRAKQTHKSENPKQKQPERQCRYCGYEWLSDHVCPAKGKQCSKCSKMNHFASVCRSQKSYTQGYDKNKNTSWSHKKVHNVEANETENDDFCIGALFTDVNAIAQDEWLQEVKVDEKNVTFQIDTGAKCNTLTLGQFRGMNCKQTIEQCNTTLRSYSGHRIRVEGALTLS